MHEPHLCRIEFCLRNVDRKTYEWFSSLGQTRDDVEVRPSGCLSRCSTCVETAFVQIDGEVLEGSSHKDLVCQKLPENASS